MVTGSSTALTDAACIASYLVLLPVSTAGGTRCAKLQAGTQMMGSQQGMYGIGHCKGLTCLSSLLPGSALQ